MKFSCTKFFTRHKLKPFFDFGGNEKAISKKETQKGKNNENEI